MKCCRFHIALLIWGLLLSPAALYSQPLKLQIPTTYQQLPFGLRVPVPAGKPKTAVVLSGGGARGLAQIGVLKALAEERVGINLITGTSMGSIVGGLYAAGYSIQDLDSIAVFTDWDDLLAVGNKIDRRELFIEQKITEDRAVLSLRLQGLKPILPNAFNDGQKLTNYFNLLIFQAPIRIRNGFDDLEIPFRAVCTDLANGAPVVLRSGSLAQAMRASSSVSFLLSPVRWDSLLLVDGGLVANVPVLQAREEGAEYVIAVNTTSELHGSEALELPWNVADQIISIPMSIINKAHLAAADVVITPELRGRTTGDFSDPMELLAQGYAAGKASASKIRNTLDSLYLRTLAQSAFSIRKPRFTGTGIITERLRGKFGGHDSVSSADLLYGLYPLLNSGEYKDAWFTLTPEGAYTDIALITIPQPEVRGFDYQGITLISQDTVNTILGALTGYPYNPYATVTAAKHILDLYRNRGYSLAELEYLKFDEATGRLSASFREGVVAGIELRGNSSTNSTIITREFPLRAGDIFTYNHMQRGLANLRGTNLFDNIIVSVERRDTGNIVLLDVYEKVSGIARFSFKLDNENLPQVYADIRDANIGGTATEVGLQLYLSQRGRSFSFEHRANRIFDTYITYNLSVFSKLNDIFTYGFEPTTEPRTFKRNETGEYRQYSYGISFATGWQFSGRMGNIIANARYEVESVKNLKDGSVTPYSMNIFSTGAAVTLDNLDRYPYARNGLFFYGQADLALKLPGTDAGYFRLLGEGKVYRTIHKAHTVAIGARLGLAEETLPLAKQFSLGGQYSFFGMREHEYRGRQILSGSLEYRYQLPFRIFFDSYLHLRYDIGQTWIKKEQIRITDLQHGLGTTLSLDTPLGPADFAVGRSFTFVKNLPDNPLSFGPVYFYFSIGFYY